GRPPIMQLAFRIELPALIVEAVSKLVTYDATYRAVVDRRVGVRVEHRRLQDARGKNNVAERAVVSIVGLRGHAPVRPIDRPRQPLDVEGPIGCRGPAHVTDQI